MRLQGGTWLSKGADPKGGVEVMERPSRGGWALTTARGFSGAVALCCALVILSSVGVGQAIAKQVSPYVYSGMSFDGSDSTAGPFEAIDYVDVDSATGTVYVVDSGHGGVLSKFNASGDAIPYSAPSLGGATSITLAPWDQGTGGVAVDNSGGPSQGNIYALRHQQDAADQPLLFGFDSTGASLGANWPVCGSSCGKSDNWISAPFGVAVDPDGTPWISDRPSEGTPPHALTPLDESGTRSATKDQLILGQEDETIAGVQCCTKDTTSVLPEEFDFDAQGNIYVVASPRVGCVCPAAVMKYDASGGLLNTAVSPPLPGNGPFGTEENDLAVDRAADRVLVNFSDHVAVYDPDGNQVDRFGQGEISQSIGVAVNPSTHDAYVPNRSGGDYRIDIYKRGPAVTVPDPTTGPAQSITQETATLTGVIDPDTGGGDTTECYFQYGRNDHDMTVPCAQGNIIAEDTGPQQVSANVTLLGCSQIFSGFCFDDFFGLPRTKGFKYSYRLVTKNAVGPQQAGRITSFRNANEPIVGTPTATSVDTDGASIEVNIDPQGGDTIYRLQYGATPEYGNAIEESLDFGFSELPNTAKDVTFELRGLAPNTTYHYKVVVDNGVGVDETSDRTFHTFPTPSLPAACPNALARQQTGAAQLLDCRAYELVSAADQGGYDVESDLVPGQTPFPGYPDAQGKALYAVHDGGIPNSGEPTNRGPDPYLATRGADGWTTRYVGIPSTPTPSIAPFSSTLAGADAHLSTFAFSGPEICSPCFDDGSAGIPLRLPDGRLVQGLDGSMDPGPSAEPAGDIGKHFSADGSHFIFGSTSQFEPDGNNSGDVSIYDRNLATGLTQVVSKMPDGTTMTGSGIAQLDVSDDGSRVVVGTLVSTDSAGNKYWRPYMHVGNSPNTVDLAPGTLGGVLYHGMNAAGTRAFFSTADPLENDTDTSLDLYAATIGESSVTVSRVSTGSSAGDVDACNPAPNSDGADWNTVSDGPDCDIVAFGGGAGIAPEAGTLYFLSPERLDGVASGTQDLPNLYVVDPDGSPRYVATLDPEDDAVRSAVSDNESRSTSGFQVNPAGNVVFTTTVSLSDYENRGHSQVYHYDPSTETLDCVSCPSSNTPATGDARLAADGLSITDDGRVFFNSVDRLVLHDANRQQDVYQWVSDGDRGITQLISTGTNENDSSLLSASTDGTDVFFFTRETRVDQDRNGPVVKIYTARMDGGFFVIPPQQPCKASDECHGAGTQAAPPATIQTVGGTDGQVRSKSASGSCGKIRTRAKRAARLAKSLRRMAKTGSEGQIRRMRNRARKATRDAKRYSKAAKRCQRRGRKAK